MAPNTLYAFLAFFPLMMIANAVEVRTLRAKPAGGGKSAWFEVLLGFGTLTSILGGFFTLNALLASTMPNPNDEMGPEVADINATIIWISAYASLFGAAGVAMASLFEWLDARRGTESD